jgi:predicted kinase
MNREQRQVHNECSQNSLDKHLSPTNQEKGSFGGMLTLVTVVGMPGTGKSTLAIALSQALGWPTIDKDTLKSALLTAGITDADANISAYELMYVLARTLLIEQHLSVILDSPDPTLHTLNDIADDAGAMLKIVLCLAERAVRNRRVAERSRKLSQPIGVSKTEGDGRQRYSHLPLSTLLLPTTEPPSTLIKQIIPYLQSAESVDESPS